MSKKIATSEAVFAACDALNASGKPWNRDDVRHRVGGGSFYAIDPLIKAWRKIQTLQAGESHTPTTFLQQIIESVESHFANLHEQFDTDKREQTKAFHHATKEHCDKIDDLSVTLSQHKHELNEAKKNQADLEQIIVERNSKIANLNEEKVKLTAQLDSISGQCTRLEKNIDQTRLQHENQTAQLKNQCEDKVTDIIKQHQSEVIKIKKELNERNEISENRLMHLLAQERDDQKQRLKNLESKIEKSQKNEGKLRDDLNQRHEALVRVKFSLKDAEKNNVSMIEQINTLTIENSSLKEKIEKLEANMVENNQLAEIMTLIKNTQMKRVKI